MPPTMIPAFLRWETDSPTVTDPLNPIIQFINNIFATQTLNDYNRKGAKGPVLIVNQVETVIIMYASGPLFDRPKIAYLTSKIIDSRPLRKWLYEYKQARTTQTELTAMSHSWVLALDLVGDLKDGDDHEEGPHYRRSTQRGSSPYASPRSAWLPHQHLPLKETMEEPRSRL